MFDLGLLWFLMWVGVSVMGALAATLPPLFIAWLYSLTVGEPLTLQLVMLAIVLWLTALAAVIVAIKAYDRADRKQW